MSSGEMIARCHLLNSAAGREMQADLAAESGIGPKAKSTSVQSDVSFQGVKPTRCAQCEFFAS
jgi:hypothetical protein